MISLLNLEEYFSAHYALFGQEACLRKGGLYFARLWMFHQLVLGEITNYRSWKIILKKRAKRINPQVRIVMPSKLE